MVPGELITDKRVRLGPNVFVEGGKVYAKVVGLAELREDSVKVIPLEGMYVPREGDHVIGIITDVKIPGYDVDINSPYTAFLPDQEVKEDVSYGDPVYARVKRVDATKNALLEGATLLRNGILVTINPKRIPRVIGKKNSMKKLIEEKADVSLTIGSNGRIWIVGKNADVVKEVILMIEREAHTSGLTDRVSKFLEEEIHG